MQLLWRLQNIMETFWFFLKSYWKRFKNVCQSFLYFIKRRQNVVYVRKM